MPSAIASAAAAMCTPASSWLIIFTLSPCRARRPGGRPSRDGVEHRLACGKGLGGPAAIIVISPVAALAAPPETGASIIRMPRSASRGAQALGVVGWHRDAHDEHAARRIAAPRRCSPNSTVSVCSAFTTSTMTTSQAPPSSAGPAQATAPASTSDCTTSGRTSHTRTGKPARSRDFATPPPIEPSPITPTLGLFMSASSPVMWTSPRRRSW